MKFGMRWVGLILGFILLLINYLDRSVFSFAIQPIERDFGLSNTEFGLIMSAFGIGYIITVIGSGILVDRAGARKIWALSAFAWSFICLLSGFATGFWTFLLLRFLLGVSESPTGPAFMKIVADWFLLGKRVSATARGFLAAPIASIIGAPLTSTLIIIYGWRSTFIILGIIGMLFASVWYLFYRDNPNHKFPSPRIIAETQSTLSNESILLTNKTSWRFILLNPTLLSNHYAFFVYGYVQFFAFSWLPGYLEQTYGMQLKRIGLFLILPWLTAAVFMLIGGILSDWWWIKTKNLRIARSHLIWVCQLLAAVCFMPVLLWHSVTVALIFISLSVGFNNMINSVLGAVNIDLVADKTSSSVAVMNFAFALAGIVSPFLTGWLSALTGNFNSAIFLMVILMISAALFIVLFHHPEKYITINDQGKIGGSNI